MPGQDVTVTGSGFPPGSPLVAELFSDPVVLGSTAADGNGAFRLVVTVPTSISPGLHTLRVRTIDGSVVADTTLAVTAPVATTAPRPVAGALSRTGGAFARTAVVAFGLVVAGSVLVGLSLGRQPGRRRRWP
jgi:hypothetical protein